MRGIDRAKMAEQGVGGAIVIDSILAPFQKEVAPGAAAGGGSSAYDPQRAGAILDAAGWKDTDGDGIRDKKMRGAKGKAASSTLRFTLTTGDSPELVAAAQMTKTMLADIGIEADVDVKSFADLGTSVIRPRAFEMLLFGQVYGYEPDPFAFWHSSQIKDPGLNIALFADKNADKILESARHTTDRAIRNQKYAEFSALVARAIPAVPLYTQLYRYLLPRDLRFAASEDNPIARIALPADRFNEINRWYRTTRRAF
jgi:peptide/nickel transport system substrate-binding protein